MLNVVRRVEQQLLNDMLVSDYTFFPLISDEIIFNFLWSRVLHYILRSRNKEYIPIVGLADYNKLSAKLIFGADRLIIETQCY